MIFKCCLTLFAILFTTLVSEEPSTEVFKSLSNAEELLQRDATPLANLEGIPSAIVHDCVNVITGEYFENTVDLHLNGAFPFDLRRVYSSNDRRIGSLAHGWSHNLGGMMERQRTPRKKYIVTKGLGGGEYVYSSPRHSFTFTIDKRLLEKGVTNCHGELSGRTNIKNNILTRNDDENYELRTGSGHFHLYRKSLPIPLLKSCHSLIRTETPARHAIHYKYDSFDEKVLTTLFQNSKNKVLNWLTFKWPTQQELKDYAKANKAMLPGKSPKMEICSKEGKKVTYFLEAYRGYQEKGQDHERYVVAKVNKTHAPEERYFYSDPRSHHTEKVIRKEWPDQRYIELDYNFEKKGDSAGKVVEIRAPAGRGPEPVTLYTFEYGRKEDEEFTKVTNALGTQITYRYPRKTKRLQTIEKTDSKEGFVWGSRADETHLMTHYIEDDQGIFFSHSYEYDSRGNVITEDIQGNLTGEFSKTLTKGRPVECYTKNFCYSDDGFNLVTSSSEEDNRWEFKYIQGSSLLSSKILFDGMNVKQREFFAYDDNSCLIEHIIDDGNQDDKNQLAGATERIIKRIKNSPTGLPEVTEEFYWNFNLNQEKLIKKSVTHYDSWGRKIQQDIYDDQNVFAYSLSWEYDEMGNLLREKNALGNVREYKYDANCNKIYERGFKEDCEKHYAYDFVNRLKKITEVDASGACLSKEFEYDAMSQLVASTDAYGKTTQFIYDANGRLIKTIYPPTEDEQGHQVQATLQKKYDELGNCISIVDPRGFETTYKNTIRGLPFEKHYPDGNSEYFVYNLKGDLVRFTAQNGSYTEFSYDYLARPVKIELFDPSGVSLAVATKKYNHFHLLEETNPAGHVVRYSYDGAGRLIQTDNEDQRTSFFYDALSRKAEEHHFYGEDSFACIRKIKKFDFLDHVTEEITQDGEGLTQTLTEYAYDADGNQTHIVRHNQAGKADYSTEYDSLGRLIKACDPLGNVTETFYDSSISQTRVVDPLGNSITKVYDGLDRLVLQYHQNKLGEILKKIRFVYDLSGNKVRHIEDIFSEGIQRQSTTAFEYDGLNRKIAEIEGYDSEFAKKTSQTYFKGLLHQIIKPNGTILSHTYDPQGRIEELKSSDDTIHYLFIYNIGPHSRVTIVDRIQGFRNERVYDQNKNLIEETLGNDLVFCYGYDRLGRRTKIVFPDYTSLKTHYRGSQLVKVQRCESDENVRYEHQFNQYDLSNNCLSATLPGPGGDVFFSFDLLNRSVGRKYKHFNETDLNYDAVNNLYSTRINDQEIQLAYDDLYQLKSERGFFQNDFKNDSCHNQIQKNGKVNAFNTLNQRIDCKYDLNGNLLEEGAHQFSYDALDRLIQVTTPTKQFHYIYDAFDRRILKRSEGQIQKYLFLEQEEIGSVNEDNTFTELRLFGKGLVGDIGSAIALELHGKTYIPMHDSRGNVIALLDSATGSPCEHYRYSAYGTEEILDGDGTIQEDSINPWRFSSKRQDPETGLLAFHKRFYNPYQARWLSPDPLGDLDGFNRYAYTKNNPYRYLDPTGQFTIAIPLFLFIFEETAFTTITLSEFLTLSCCAIAAWAGEKGFNVSVNANALAEEAEKEDEKKKKRPVVFPENPDDFMPELKRDEDGYIKTGKDVRVRPEKHPAKPGEKYNPRHHGQHYHVDVKNPDANWNRYMKPKDCGKCKPPGYNKGDGTGFLPGESFPDIPNDYRVLNGK